jgi:predicted XRE-type DNA-binding protein
MRKDEHLPCVEHTTPADGNVFLDLGFDPDEAANLLVRADLMIQMREIIRSRKLKQKDAAKLFGVSQPRISDLMRSKIDAFTIDSLVNMLGNARMRVQVTVAELPAQYQTREENAAQEQPSAARA